MRDSIVNDRRVFVSRFNGFEDVLLEAKRATQASSWFLASVDYSPGLLCMMPPSVKTVVAVM
jgi:hypothetical protein